MLSNAFRPNGRRPPGNILKSASKKRFGDDQLLIFVLPIQPAIGGLGRNSVQGPLIGVAFMMPMPITPDHNLFAAPRASSDMGHDYRSRVGISACADHRPASCCDGQHIHLLSC